MPGPWRVLLLAAVAGLITHGCGNPECLMSDCQIIDSSAARIRLCGFPREQVVEGEFAKSFMHVGQAIPVQLRGDLDRLVSVKWRVEPQSGAPNPPDVRFDPRASTAAMLTAVAVGGSHPTDYVFVSAELLFRDGSEGWATVAYCQGEAEWHPANQIIVVP